MNKTEMDKYVAESKEGWDNWYNSHDSMKKKIKVVKKIVNTSINALAEDTGDFQGMQQTIDNLDLLNKALEKANVKFYVGNIDLVKSLEFDYYLKRITPGMLSKLFG